MNLLEFCMMLAYVWSQNNVQRIFNFQQVSFMYTL